MSQKNGGFRCFNLIVLYSGSKFSAASGRRNGQFDRKRDSSVAESHTRGSRFKVKQAKERFHCETNAKVHPLLAVAQAVLHVSSERILCSPGGSNLEL